jgi:hypothetical protein
METKLLMCFSSPLEARANKFDSLHEVSSLEITVDFSKSRVMCLVEA